MTYYTVRWVATHSKNPQVQCQCFPGLEINEWFHPREYGSMTDGLAALIDTEKSKC